MTCEPEASSVSVVQDGAVHLFSPCRHLGGKWPAYQDAVTGSKFVDLGERGKHNVMKGDERVAAAVAKLQAAGLVVRVDEPTRAVIAQGAEVLRKRANEGAAQHAAAHEAVTTSGESMKAHQDPGISWLASRRSALLLDEMGLGKTMQTVLSGLPGEAQVIACPAAVVGAWVAEFARWRPDLQVQTLDSASEFVWPAPGCVLVTTHDRIPPARQVVVERLLEYRDRVLRWLAAACAGYRVGKPPTLRSALPTKSKPQGPTRLVFDEVHEFRTTSSDRYRNAKVLARDALKAGGRLLGLTGTPMQNRPCELKAVLDLTDLFAESFGSWTRYTKAFGGPEAVRKSNAEPTPAVLEALARVALRRTLEGEERRTAHLSDGASAKMKLPPLTYEVRRVPLAGQAVTAATDLAEMVQRRCPGFAERATPTTEELAAALESSSELGSIQVARRLVALAKLPAAVGFVESCEAAGEPVVVGTCCADVARILGQRPGWGCIVGDQTPRERTAVVKAFQEGELKGVAVSMRAGGTGITLTHASVLLLVDLDWNPARNAQMVKRIHRIGQTRPCRIVTLVGDCWIDAAVHSVTRDKRALAAGALDGLEEREAPRTLVPDLAALRAPPCPGGLVVDAALRRRFVDGALAGRPLASWLHARWPRVGDLAPGAVRRRGVMRPTLDLLIEEGS